MAEDILESSTALTVGDSVGFGGYYIINGPCVVSISGWDQLSVCLCFLELFQADVDEFCQYYGRKDGGLCFPDFHRKQLRRDSNYLLDEKIEVINRYI